MAKKSYDYAMMGDKKCVKCGKKLKKRIEVDHPNFNKCYHCFKGLPKKEEK